LEEQWATPFTGRSWWEAIQSKLNNCRVGLVRWHKTKGEPMQQSITDLQGELKELQGCHKEVNGAEMKATRLALQGLLNKEDLRWRQRAKSDWLKGGDRNTRFFHACANARKKANHIAEITDIAGTQFSEPEEVQMAFINYFSDLFTYMEAVLQNLENRVTEEMNCELLKPFLAEEIKMVLFQMGPLKAPSPDSFLAGFYQMNWNTVGGDICHAILETLNSSILPSFFNVTNIALIPKIKKPTCVMEFRPISLCNVTYKLISKVLANRLKKILPTIISPV
jgi:hypothetical protein